MDVNPQVAIVRIIKIEQEKGKEAVPVVDFHAIEEAIFSVLELG